MRETRTQLTERKIRNGLRKQAAVIQKEKEKIWDRLKEVKKPSLSDMQIDVQSVQAVGRTLRGDWTYDTEYDTSYSINESAINSVVRSIGKQNE